MQYAKRQLLQQWQETARLGNFAVLDKGEQANGVAAEFDFTVFFSQKRERSCRRFDHFDEAFGEVVETALNCGSQFDIACNL
ncbi:hypothetical protein D3C80_2039160 [compost metagenome]